MSEVSLQAKFMADYLWDQQAKVHPEDDDKSNLYMFLDHNLDEALQAWSAREVDRD